MTFSTRIYELEHSGKTPKGTGMWVFATNPDDQETWKFFYGTLTQAKNQAKEAYKDSPEFTTIYIMP